MKRFDTDFYKLLLIELTLTLFISIGMLDRAFSFLLLGLIAGFFFTKPFKQSLALFLVSLPFFLALPIAPSFDTMSLWRPLSLLLVLMWLWERRAIVWKSPLQFWQQFLERKPLLYITGAMSVFVFLATISLFWARDIVVGARAVVYFINIFLIFFIYAWEFNKDDVFSLLKKAALISAFSLFIGFVQFGITFSAPLHVLWQWWATHPTLAYYGQATSILVSYSNTWFSYYGEGIPATLRLFSFFQDSHAFAMFSIMGLAVWISFFLFFKNTGDNKGKFYSLSFIILSLLAIILSGSRGAWVSAIPLLALFFALYIKKPQKLLVSKQFISYGLLGFIIFFLLFPVSTLLLAGQQKAQLVIEGRGGEAADLRLAFLRAKSAFDIDETSNKGRLEIWQDSFNFVKKSKGITGTGIGNFPTAIELTPEKARIGASAHSLYLQFLVELGLFGLLAFLTILFFILKQAYNVLTLHVTSAAADTFHALYAFSFILAFSWILIYSVVDVTLLNDKILLFTLILASFLYVQDAQAPPQKNTPRTRS